MEGKKTSSVSDRKLFSAIFYTTDAHNYETSNIAFPRRDLETRNGSFPLACAVVSVLFRYTNVWDIFVYVKERARFDIARV